MARTAIPTFVTGHLITAAEGNSWWRDNEAYYYGWKTLDAEQSFTLTGNKWLNNANYRRIVIDCGGANRYVSLPAISAGVNHPFTITNESDEWEIITVRDADMVNIAYIRPGQTLNFYPYSAGAAAWACVSRNYRQMWIPAGAFKPTLTSGCLAVNQFEMATNKNVYDALGFVDGATSGAYVSIPQPLAFDTLNAGFCFLQIYWFTTAAGTAPNNVVRFEVANIDIATATTMDEAVTGTAADYTGGTANRLYITPITSSGIWWEGSSEHALQYIRLTRMGTHANDKFAQTAYVIGCLLTYPAVL
jgi:hypothetical protein